MTAISLNPLTPNILKQLTRSRYKIQCVNQYLLVKRKARDLISLQLIFPDLHHDR